MCVRAARVCVCALQFNLSHKIDRLSFGTEYPGLVNPLDGHKVELEERKWQVQMEH